MNKIPHYVVSEKNYFTGSEAVKTVQGVSQIAVLNKNEPKIAFFSSDMFKDDGELTTELPAYITNENAIFSNYKLPEGVFVNTASYEHILRDRFWTFYDGDLDIIEGSAIVQSFSGVDKFQLENDAAFIKSGTDLTVYDGSFSSRGTLSDVVDFLATPTELYVIKTGTNYTSELIIKYDLSTLTSVESEVINEPNECYVMGIDEHFLYTQENKMKIRRKGSLDFITTFDATPIMIDQGRGTMYSPDVEYNSEKVFVLNHPMGGTYTTGAYPVFDGS